MVEQELEPGARPRRTLRETERRRQLRNRLLGVGALVTLAIAVVSAVRRAWPQWMEMPGNATVSATQAKIPSASPVNRSALAVPEPSRLNTPVRALQANKVTSGGKLKSARRVTASSRLLGPEILPVEEAEVPRRHKRRKRRAAQTTPAKTPAEQNQTGHAKTGPAKPTPAEPPHPEPNSKPPDDVPDNP